MPPCACPLDPAREGRCTEPGLAVGQGGCRNTYPQQLADELGDTATACRAVRSSPGAPTTSDCEVTSARSVIGGSWVDAEAGKTGNYATDYVAGVRGNAELGFRTFYQSCGDDMLSGVPCPADLAQGAQANLGVVTGSGLFCCVVALPACACPEAIPISRLVPDRCRSTTPGRRTHTQRPRTTMPGAARGLRAPSVVAATSCRTARSVS